MLLLSQGISDGIDNYIRDGALKKDRSSYSLACTYALAGKREQAFQALEANLSSLYKVRMSHIVQDADLASLHADARWEAITKKQWYSPSEGALHDADVKIAPNDLPGALAAADKAINLDSRNAKAFGNGHCSICAMATFKNALKT